MNPNTKPQPHSSNPQHNHRKQGLIQKRSCTDWACVVVFGIVFLGCFGGGGYLLVKGQGGMEVEVEGLEDREGFGLGVVILKNSTAVFRILGGSVVLSIILVLLTKTWPKPTIYSLISMTLILQSTLLIHTYSNNFPTLPLLLLLLLLTQTISLVLTHKTLLKSLKLIECASRFLNQKPAVYCIALIWIVVDVSLVVFWIKVYMNMLQREGVDGVLVGVWVGVGFFWGGVVYYGMVFGVGYVCGCWYYGRKQNSVIGGFRNMVYHVGSLTFASLSIPLTLLLTQITQILRKLPLFLQSLPCLPCLHHIRHLSNSLNSYSIIQMSITGEGFIKSAKSANAVIMDSYSFWRIVSLFGWVFVGFGNLGVIGVLGVVGGMRGDWELWEELMEGEWVVIVGLSLVLNTVILGVLTQALNCIYIFYCLDKNIQTTIASQADIQVSVSASASSKPDRTEISLSPEPDPLQNTNQI